MDKVHAFLLKIAESDGFIAFEGFLADYGLYIAAFLSGFWVAMMIFWAVGKKEKTSKNDITGGEEPTDK